MHGRGSDRYVRRGDQDLPRVHGRRGLRACDSKIEGDSVCDSNTLSTCHDSDGDTCLNKVTTACGSKYTCDADNDKCGFTGAEQCDTTITAVLAVDATSDTFDTGAGTPASHYDTWSACPMLQGNTFTAAAPDLLFAIDVPPKTVVDVSLVGVTGFAGTNTSGAWVEVLTTCGGSGNTQAEASCKAIARAPSYANETNNPVRIYVVVDADGDNTTTGTFKVKVASHKFACGDGVRDGSEACDDANVHSGDGCTATCTAESGFLCTKANPSVCTRRPPSGATAAATSTAARHRQTRRVAARRMRPAAYVGPRVRRELLADRNGSSDRQRVRRGEQRVRDPLAKHPGLLPARGPHVRSEQRQRRRLHEALRGLDGDAGRHRPLPVHGVGVRGQELHAVSGSRDSLTAERGDPMKAV